MDVMELQAINENLQDRMALLHKQLTEMTGQKLLDELGLDKCRYHLSRHNRVVALEIDDDY